jgi:hypothetical protein
VDDASLDLLRSIAVTLAMLLAGACSEATPEDERGPPAGAPERDGSGAADGGVDLGSSSVAASTGEAPPPMECPETCASVAGIEGRCLSLTLPDVAAYAEFLPQDACPDEHLCVPCYEPFGGEATGACSLSCDPGPSGPPVTFDACCGGIGACVPTEAVPADQTAALGVDTCMAGNLCAPVALLDGSYVAQACETSKLASLGDEYGPGACLPACLAALDHPMLKQDGCPDGFKCAPCKAPPDGEDTGACDWIR